MRHFSLLGIIVGCLLTPFALTRAAEIPPSVALVSPADGATWGQTSAIQVTATASDPDGTISRVEFYLNDVLGGTSTAPVQNTLGSYSVFLSPRPAAGTYTLKARAFDNAGNSMDSATRVLQVPEGQLPTVVTGTSTPTATSAQLSGTINANDTYISNQNWYFEVGTTASYVATAKTIIVGAIQGNLPTSVAAGINGLQRNTTYHYRLVATNYAGTVYGEDATFTTPQNLEPTAYDASVNVVGTEPVPVPCVFDDPDGDPMTITAVSTPLHGSVTMGGALPNTTFTYTPNETFSGQDQFTYTVSDGYGGTATATVYLANIRSEAIGRYVTTIHDNGGRAVGEIALNITATGRFTGSIRLFGVQYPIRGQFSLDGNFSTEVDRVGQPPLTVNLGLGGNANGLQLGGSLLTHSDEYEIEPDVALEFPQDAPEAGSYTVSLPPDDPAIPQGAGFVSGRVFKHGQVVFLGQIGDGQAFSFTTQLRHGGSAQFFVMAGAAPRDRLFGKLQFPGVRGSECTGELVWDKAPRTSGFYQAGFRTVVPVTGSRFEAGPIDETLLVYTGALADLDIVFTDADNNDILGGILNGTTEQSLSFAGGAGPRAASVVSKPVKITVSRTRGTFTGTMRISSEPTKTHKFHGVLLQHQNMGAGLVNVDGRTGKVTLSPK